MKIEYKGKTINTSIYSESSEEERLTAKTEFFSKPDKSVVIAQMRKIASGGVMNDKITRYYFRDLMCKTQCATAKWTVEDVFESPELFSLFKGKVERSPKTFDPSCSLAYNIGRAISLGGKAYAQIPTNFPVKVADEVIEKYGKNDTVYDFSCGWGARLTSALKHNKNYFGTDPNYLLIERLNNLTNDWKSNISNNSKVVLKDCGSEIFIPEWVNSVGLAFSSPPYFDLENYNIGEQSIKLYPNYNDWLLNYFEPTIENIRQYLIPEGILALNIKDLKNHNLTTDTSSIIYKKGFELIDIIPLKNIKRVKSIGGLVNSTDESVYIYQKLDF